MKICYIEHAFNAASLKTIETANRILEEYAAQGYDLTLRQLYYQFVSRGLIANKDSEYKRLGSTINDARLAGLVDWDHITDRTRNLRKNAHWDSPKDIVAACASQFQHDKWSTQTNYVEVWVEKDALVGVLQVACEPLDVPYFSCRGYTSQSEMWVAGMRLLKKVQQGKRVNIIHLGDHDPSGIDMTRDIEDRVSLFIRHHLNGISPRKVGKVINRIALNMNQVREYEPPPNPAKITDSRAAGYINEYGDESWELDALEPSVLNTLIRDEVFALRDVEAWEAAVERENDAKARLEQVSDNWDEIVRNL